ncbi:MAG: EscU/YscU/HrcU family type III secretion system export apparatus switch protein [Deltaproteobacteria bacterium]|nr:EscU/YscU/HrcU family type III secretion system export apparatus switch protein [Deltaproteobacteria bacterium]
MGSQKRFEPTRKKRQKARDEGDVAKSSDFSSIVGLSVGLIYLVYFSNIFRLLTEFFTFFFGFDKAFTSNSVYIYSSGVFSSLALKLLVLFFVVLVGVVLCEVIQVGFHFSFKALAFDFSRLNPFKNLAQRFGLSSNDENSVFLGKVIIDALKIILLLSVVVLSAAIVAYSNLDSIFNCDSINFYDLVIYLIEHQAVLSLVGMIVIGFLDLLLQKHKHSKKLMMDLQELKQEIKDSEGDPEILARRKMLHREIASHEIIQAVRQAKVVIVDK